MRKQFNSYRTGALVAIIACSLATFLGMTPVCALGEDAATADDVQLVLVDRTVDDHEAVADTEEPTGSDAEAAEQGSSSNTQLSNEEDIVVQAQDHASADTPVTQDDVPADEIITAEQDNSGGTQEAVDGTATGEDGNTMRSSALRGSPALPANSQNVAEGTYVIEAGIAASDQTGLAGLVLDARGGVKEGTYMITWTYSGNDNQKWSVIKDPSGWYTIASHGDGSLVLTATNDKGKIYLTKYVSGLASQLWAFLLSGTSYGTGYQIVPQGIQRSATNTEIVSMGDNKAADVRKNSSERGAEIITYTRSSTVKGNQSFYLVNPTSPTVSGGPTDMEGRYRIGVPGTTAVVEVRRASAANGANVWLYASNGKTHQDVYLQHEGKGFYSVWIMGTGKVLELRGGSILPGANIVQWSYDGTDKQLWAMRKNADGTYSLVNKATGLVLGAASEAAGSSGTNLAGAQDNGRTNNLFTLKRMSLISAGIYKIVETGSTKVLDVSKASTEDGAKLCFYTDKNSQNQRFELVSAGGTDLWRIRTASSGGWITYIAGSDVIQQGNHATAADANNTWQVRFRNGGYTISSVNGNQMLVGGKQRSVTFTLASILLQEGLFEVKTKLGNAVLDIPKSSKTSGTKVNVYTDKKGENQKFVIEKAGTGYKIANLVSGLVLTATSTAEGSTVVQQAYSSSNDAQVWLVGIADGGYFKLINKASGKALDISGDSAIASNVSMATQMATDSAEREARQSWKMAGASGWASYKGIMTYFNSGTRITVSPQAWTLYNMIKNMASMTKYLIAIYPDNPRFVIFQGSKGNWVPIKDWECGTGAAEADGKSRSLRGAWKLGEGRGEEYDGGRPLTAEAGKYGKSINLPGYSGCTYGYFINGKWAIHSTMPGVPESQQVNRLVSHGCIRLRLENAKWVYYNMPRYTRVWSVPRVVPSDIAFRLSLLGAGTNDLYR